MKSFLLGVALGGTLAASTLVVSTSAWAQDGTTAPQTAPAALVPATTAPDTAPFLWQLRLRAGQKFLSTTEVSGQTTQQMPAMPGAPKTNAPVSMENTSKSRIVTEMNVLSSDEKGARVEMVYREMTQTSKVRQGDKVIYDSANPPAELKGLADISKSIVGARISYLLGPKGEISDVQGVQEYLDKLSEGMEKGLAGTPAAGSMKKMMAGFLSPEAIKNSIGATYSTFPTKALAPGETWKYTLVTPVMGMDWTQNGEGTFVSRQGGIVTLLQKGGFSTDGGAALKIPMPASPDKNAPAPIMQIDLQGTSTSQSTIDEQSGLTLENRTTQDIEGEVVMSGATGKGSVLSIPMKVKSETVTKTEEIKTAT